MNGLILLIIGIIVSVYVLSNREAALAGARKVLYSLFEVNTAENIRRGLSFVDKTFMGFLSGKLGRKKTVLLGILLIPVVGALLVWPSACKILLIFAIILYFCCRIAFICKGFRIFYSNLPSLVYFILYLCSVEIVPLVLLGAGTVYFSTLLIDII